MMKPRDLNTSKLIHRLCLHRDMTINQVPTRARSHNVEREWKNALTKYVSKPLDPNNHVNDVASEFFFKTYHPTQPYSGNYDCWEKFHEI